MSTAPVPPIPGPSAARFAPRRACFGRFVSALLPCTCWCCGRCRPTSRLFPQRLAERLSSSRFCPPTAHHEAGRSYAPSGGRPQTHAHATGGQSAAAPASTQHPDHTARAPQTHLAATRARGATTVHRAFKHHASARANQLQPSHCHLSTTESRAASRGAAGGTHADRRRRKASAIDAPGIRRSLFA